MTAFFMLSGYVIEYNSSPASDSKGLMDFYKKRFIAIIPPYWGIALLYILFTIAVMLLHDPSGLQQFVKTTVFLFPIQTIALQSAFSSLFEYSHNGGTWFISCIVACYFVFPLLRRISAQFSQKNRIILIISLVAILLYSSLIPHYFHNVNNIYSDIVFRTFEFFIGVLLADITISSKVRKTLCNWWAFVLEFAAMSVAVTIAILLTGTNDYMLLSFFTILPFIMMIITLAHIQTGSFLKSKAVDFACKISYMFWFAQFFTWIPVRFLGKYYGIDGNIEKILISFTLCFVISVLLHKYMEIPVKKLSKKLIYKQS